MKHQSTDRSLAAVQSRHRRIMFLLAGGLILTALISLGIGRYPAAGFTPLRILLQDRTGQTIVMQLRLPRIITAMLAGAVLAGSGFVFQMLFSNPLVEPGFLGVSQGAAFGAAFAIVLVGYQTLLIQISSAAFAVLGLSLSFMLARRFHFGGWILRLILAGIAVSAFFSSGIGLIKYGADPLSELSAPMKRRPRQTRAISRNTRGRSSTNSSTVIATPRSNAPASNGSASAPASTTRSRD